MEGLSKQERLYGKSAIANLLKEGRFGHEDMLKFCWLYRADGSDVPCNRMMISVSKRFFKRAVKRNLLKRRLREAYRKSKNFLNVPGHVDIMFIYNDKEIAEYKDIKVAVEKILTYISNKITSDSATKEVAAE